jgi:hypothetical protein
MADTEFVRVRECPDGTHEEGDGVFIATTLSLDCGIAARQAIVSAHKEGGGDEALMDAALIRHWFKAYARFAPVSWTLHDAGRREPWPFDTQRLVDDYALGYPVADRADDLYRDEVMRPLLEAPSKPSPRGDLDGSTSATTTSTGSRRASSSRRASAGRRSGVHTP